MAESYRIVGPSVMPVGPDEPTYTNVLVGVHDPENCAGRRCVIHSPTQHHMRGWPLRWRADRRVFERVCDHGIGHPDPDQFEYWREIGTEYERIHGCCDCCCIPEAVTP
jgi:hypothetical protein